MAFNTAIAGVRALSTHLLQVIYALNGTAGQGQPIALTALSDASNPALDVRNSAAGGALRVKDTAGTTITTISDSGMAIGTTAAITSASASALTVGLNGATNPALQVDASTASQAAGLKVTGATSAGTVAVAAISSGAAANLSVDALGTGTITLGGTSTGNIVSTRLHTFSAGATVTGAVTFSTNAISTTALATPSALSATQFTGFASTVSGAVLMGYGTTGDVTLKNRAGTDVLYVGPNTQNVHLAAAVSQIVPGSTSLSLRNNANNADNLILTDAGAATIRAGLTVSAGGAVLAASVANGITLDVQNSNTSGVNSGLKITGGATNAAARNWAIVKDSAAFGDFAVMQSSALGGDPVATGTRALTLNADRSTTLAGGLTVSAGGVAVTGASSVTGTTTLTSANAAALAVGPNGATNPTFRVDGSFASLAAGVKVYGLGSPTTSIGVAAISSGADTALYLDSKGAGSILLNAASGTGSVQVGQTLALAANNLTMTGTISATGARVTQSYHTNITSTNAVTVDSSLRSKVPESVQDYVGDALAILRRVKVKTFRHLPMIDPSGRTKLGVVAETITEPLALQEIDDPEGGEPYPGVNLMGLLALQTRALQQLTSRIAALEQRLLPA